ncbi:MAG TPA: asparagine synthase-related protein, partial [Gemmatimonadales bacterium]|nr:asparagine synthase-related protein [Gemmatimonadales bacterium]
RRLWRQAARQGDAGGMAESPLWTSFFFWSDPGFSRLPLRFRHPFFDLRLVEYVRAIPPVPWLLDKRLLREAMRDLLPPSVLQRPKTVLARNPTEAASRQRGLSPGWISLVAHADTLGRFMCQEKLRGVLESAATAGRVTNINLGHSLSLALWLQYWRRPVADRTIQPSEFGSGPASQPATVA